MSEIINKGRPLNLKAWSRRKYDCISLDLDDKDDGYIKVDFDNGKGQTIITTTAADITAMFCAYLRYCSDYRKDFVMQQIEYVIKERRQ